MSLEARTAAGITPLDSGPQTPARGAAEKTDRPAFFSPHSRSSGSTSRGDDNDLPLPPTNLACLIDDAGLSSLPLSSLSVLPPIRVINFENFRLLSSFPRFPDNSDITEVLEIVDPDVTVFIFVSHCWLRGWSGASGWDGKPHPDDAQHRKFALVCEAVEKIKNVFAPDMTQCYLWLDFGCIDQDNDPAAELKQLLKIVQMSDCILTPLVDLDHDVWTSRVKSGAEEDSWFCDYLAPSWREGDHSYLQRAWCRMEMFYAANVPLPHQSNDEYFSSWKRDRIEKFAEGLKTAMEANRRPHLLYGSRESSWCISPVVLPPLQNSYLEEFSPAKGKLTMQSDRPKIEALMAELEPFMTKPQYGYTGPRNERGEEHGEGKLINEDGSSYIGAYVDGHWHGEGTYIWPNGDQYKGAWEDDLQDGYGEFREAAGGLYIGLWKKGVQHGEGEQHKIDRIYKGSWVNGCREGDGVMTYLSENTQYIGNWKAGARDGAGELRWDNGDRFEGAFCNNCRVSGKLTQVHGYEYEGQWENERKNGQGREQFPSGSFYEGSFRAGKRHGRGVMTHPDGSRYVGDYLDGLREGHGSTTHLDGTGYEGGYVRDVRDGFGVAYGPGRAIEWQGEWTQGNRV